MKTLAVLLAGTAIVAGPTAAFAGTLPPPPQPSGVTAAKPAAPIAPAVSAAKVPPAAKSLPGAPVAKVPPVPPAAPAVKVPPFVPDMPGTKLPPASTTPVSKIRPIANRTRALILTYANGETAKPERYAVLNCPASSAPLRRRDEEACGVVNRVRGDLTQLKPSQNTFCPMMFSPVTVTAHGIWDGRYVDFRHTFGNACEMHSATGSVFDI
ncbi:SSI family serine proteinase inhibitor [Planotetraspora kaengkrachanensis]|nr:SSI family serine proteinase inhibitor [Planotetraspora kaengkrachanensis]